MSLKRSSVSHSLLPLFFFLAPDFWGYWGSLAVAVTVVRIFGGLGILSCIAEVCWFCCPASFDLSSFNSVLIPLEEYLLTIL